jgi:ethanolamine utilization protein EutA
MVPRLEIAQRRIIYRSAVHFTPLVGQDLVDGQGIREMVEAEYRAAGITRAQVDTGAVIVTGETSRKENARAVLEALAEYAGDFVVATAGPDLESVLAAKGAGAVAFSADTGKKVLHMDIGGGTSNLTQIADGKICATSCLNIGGRLLKIDPDQRLTYVSPVLEGLFSGKVGDYVNRETVMALCCKLVQALEWAAGLRQEEPWMRKLCTAGAHTPEPFPGAVISFSGGVADCINREQLWLAFGDMGPELGRAIRESRLCRGEYVLGEETIRATVIGAGCHSTQLSGSTVFYRNVAFPMKNLPVVESVEALRKLDGPGVLALEGERSPDYSRVAAMAEELAGAFGGRPLLLALREDMAKALGQQLALRTGTDGQILCIDRVMLKEGDYLDVGAPVGPALPVVVKTLILSK